jgi:dolichyl-phosphate beta-glucosyltransferase
METRLSIVIPAYNESGRLGATLRSVRSYARARPHTCEILVVDDGSTDATADVAREHAAQDSSVRLVANGSNRGKGYSVRRGMLEAKGRFVLFTDADLSAPIEEADRLIGCLENGYDVAIGSRALRESRVGLHQPFLRENMGRVFNLLLRAIVMSGIHDSQCGFKCAHRAVVRDVFHRQTIDGFGFDAEMLYVAMRLGYRIAEVPVQWRNSSDTRVNMLTDPATMLVDLFRIRWRHRKLAPARPRQETPLCL